MQPFETVEFDPALIRKYNRPGPRYTSYPTALRFSESVDRDALIDDLRAGTGDLSLYFHLPFCESLCWFCGCTTVITGNRDRADGYLDALESELDLYRDRIAPDRKVAQLHFGGGTPNFLRPEQIERLGRIIHDRFEFLPDAESSVELAPAHLSREQVEAFSRIGINRASFGIQDIQPEVQKAIHRNQPHAINIRTIEWLRAAGFVSVNVDLIYGLPKQTPQSFSETLEAVIGLDPDRLAVFSYAHVPWVAPAQKILERASLPEPETKLELIRMLTGKLIDSGYQLIGMDHFAKADDPLAVAQREGSLQRNFQGYSTRAGLEICAFGMSSISQSENTYRQNHKSLADYLNAVAERRLPLERGYLLSKDDRIRRDTIHRLMCDLKLDYARQSARLGIDFTRYFARELTALREMEADGLVALGADGLVVQPLGRLLIRNLAMHFDAYLGADATRYSKTV